VKKKARFLIRGAWWKILVAPPPNAPEALGVCDYETKTIYIHQGVDLVETLIHEATHAACPNLDETAVNTSNRPSLTASLPWAIWNPSGQIRSSPRNAKNAKNAKSALFQPSSQCWLGSAGGAPETFHPADERRGDPDQ
jgi:hypothetical protein